MKKSMWWMLLPMTVVLAVIGVFYVLYPERFTSDRTLVVSVVLAAAAAGTLVYSTIAGIGGQSAGDGRPGLIGIGTILSALLLLVAFSGVALAISGLAKGAMALNIVSVAGFAALLIVTLANSSGGLGFSFRKRSNTKSNHIAWAERLEGIARSSGMPQLKPRLLKLAGETRYLADDEGRQSDAVDQRIAGVLDTVAEAVRRGDEQLAIQQIKRLRNLFAERETELMNLKSRM
jgi:hypothetical protein